MIVPPTGKSIVSTVLFMFCFSHLLIPKVRSKNICDEIAVSSGYMETFITQEPDVSAIHRINHRPTSQY